MDEVGVHHDSSTNSTYFTNCCGTAICRDQRTCPRCGKLVIGHDAATDYEREEIRWNYARQWRTRSNNVSG